jgi:hypothetical protein
MELNYPQKGNGLYILKRNDIEDIATKTLKEYMPFIFDYCQEMNVEYLAEECLFNTIENRYLSLDGTILGVMSFGKLKGTVFDDMLQPEKIIVEDGTMMIDKSLLAQRKRRRYTIAHEASHWILHRSYHSPTKQNFKYRKQQYFACRESNIENSAFTPSDDTAWEEWQADNLAAALLMPKQMFEQFATSIIRKTGASYLIERKFSRLNYEIIEEISDMFDVSKQAASIRLKKLGFIR